ncbi:hypothetical protein [Chryseobacterium sp. P1-3]|uniref:hypothetical protein n=1 Tax=Chryseobacterium sp. (strain P1-3) TaxID=1517683 RepID=UPI003977494C
MNKSYFPLTYYIKNNPKFGTFWNILFDEYELSKDIMLELTGFKMLQEEDPLSRKSVKIREKNCSSVIEYSTIRLDEDSKRRRR